MIVSAFIFFLGAAVGSFLSCLIYRLETDQSFITGRSFCPHCRHALAWIDLIPLLSFVWLRGRCRYCQKPIPWQDLLLEIFTGAIFLWIFNYQFSLLNFFVASALIAIFVFDLKHCLIPDEVIYPAILLILVFRSVEVVFGDSTTSVLPLNYLGSGLGASLFFWLIYVLSRGKGLGFGDVKLVFLMGLFLGFPGIFVALFFAFLVGAMTGLALMIWGHKTLKSELPFAPFLVAGTFFALFYGEAAINFYLSFFI